MTPHMRAGCLIAQLTLPTKFLYTSFVAMNFVRHQMISSGMRCQQRVSVLTSWPKAGTAGGGNVGGTA